MKVHNSMGILETLVEKKIIGREDLEAIKDELREGKKPVEEILELHGVSEADILFAKGAAVGIPTRSLENVNVPFEVLKYVPEESAQHYRFVPIAIEEGALEIGIVNPEDLEARDAITFAAARAGMPYKLFLITEADFDRVIQTYRGLSGEVTKALSELESEISTEEAELSKQKKKGVREPVDTKIIEDAPVTKIVATILHYAVEGAASDIHVEHLGDKIRVRFRVDGILNTSLTLPAKVHAAVVARIKILCNMRLDEKRKPQDGRFSARIGGRKVDFRVSTFPAYFGEKVVMRILDSEKGVLPVDALGLSKRNVQLIRDAIDRPYGMILISGPTGSGKSTTLYSMLNEIDRDTENVLSLEDPVEYNIPGMNQSQVHPEIGYTFASGLRSTLRQDPDVIMVGEIRDKETAQLAIQAALTGHLVLSTIHTNNATGVIPRLIDMGVDPYLIAPTLILAVAQRLVKRLYPNTGTKLPVEGSIKLMLEKQFADLPHEIRDQVPFGEFVYQAEPTAECPTGTRGRIAVVEMLSMNNELEQAILHNPTEPAIMDIARKQGMLTMKEDAILKAFDRVIPFEEVSTL